MNDERSHPLLQQTPLSVNPYIDLPKAPTLPHNYATIPSTLPPSSMNAVSAASNPDLPAYVTSSSGFASHPSTIIAQSRALLEQLEAQRIEGQERIRAWEQSIQDRELQEKRRTAPGWLDSDSKLLQPARVEEERTRAQQAQTQTKAPVDLMDDPQPTGPETQKSTSGVDDLGAAMDRAFGRSEMGG